MESYINIKVNKIKDSTDFDELTALLKGIAMKTDSISLDECKKIIETRDSSLLQHFSFIFDEYQGNLNEAECINSKTNSIDVKWVCGSSGLDCLIRLMYIFGPLTKDVEGEYYDDDWMFDIKLEYMNGNIVANGIEINDVKDAMDIKMMLANDEMA